MTKQQNQQEELAPTMQELMVQMARMQAELDSLKERAQALPQPVPQPKAGVSTTRRKLLRQLAGGLIAGLAVAGIGVTSPNEAKAKLSSNPSGNGLTGRVGMLVMPPGTSVSGTMGGGAGNKVGLLVTGDSPTFNIPAVVAPSVNSAIIGYTSSNGTAIAGISQTGIGIYGQSTDNFAVWGSSTTSIGVRGVSIGSYGVQGESTNGSGVRGTGITGVAGSGSYALYGSTLTGYAIYAESGYRAGYFSGTVQVDGTLTSTNKQFKIDHPLDPANKYLYHTSVESPDMKNIYDGVVILNDQGTAIITMPDWFEALNSDFRYQLTSIGISMPNLFIAEEMKEHKFKIAGGQPGQKVSWMVTGIRQDVYAMTHRSPVEEVKNDKEKGKYLHPKLLGKSEELSVHTRPVAAK